MGRLIISFFMLFFLSSIRSQNPNDNCENAIDITQQVFHYLEFPESCNSIIGTLHSQHGFVSDSIDHISVDDQIYGSQNCIGYQPETTDQYPDIWYKVNFHDWQNIEAQSFFLWAGDTVQVAIYYGQCGSLFQSHCFTLTYLDSTYWQGAWIKYYPHNPEDNIYIQLKFPPQYHDVFEVCFSSDVWVPGVGVQYYFEYDRPATTQGGAILSPVKYIPIEILPNPTNNWIQIRSDDEILSYSITGLQGKVWLDGKGHKKDESIFISSFSSGMYIITVKTAAGLGISRFLKL